LAVHRVPALSEPAPAVVAASLPRHPPHRPPESDESPFALSRSPSVDSIEPMPTPLAVFEFVALLSSGLFAGAALYISFVEHPARMQSGTTIALAEFAPSYKRATIMQASLAALGTIAATAAWLQGAPAPWLIGGLLLGAVIPFTLIVILPTNKRLLDPSLDKDSKLADQLLHRWAKLHAVRTALSLASFLVFLFAALWR